MVNSTGPKTIIMDAGTGRKKRLQGQRQKRKWRQILPFGATLEERGMLKLIVFQKGARDLGIVE